MTDAPTSRWLPIATCRVDNCLPPSLRWLPIEGAPVSLDEARAALDSGRGTMAQRRIGPDAFVLLFTWLGTHGG